MSQKIYSWNNVEGVADEEQSGPGLWEFAGESGSDSAKTAYWGLRYINILVIVDTKAAPALYLVGQ